MRDFWNDRYRTDDYVYGTNPNAFFKENIDQMVPGKILLPAEGEGRNALYASGKGWKVTAFDFSEVAKKKAEMLTFSKNFTIDYQVSSWQDFQGTENYYDMIGLFFFHLMPSERKRFHSLLIHWLKPGGTIVAELFSKKQINLHSGGPKSIQLLYEQEELKNDFSDLDILRLEETKRNLQEGKLHDGNAWVLQMMARKK